MTLYTIHVSYDIDHAMLSPKVVSFLAASDDAALSIASHFCIEKQIGVELFEYGGPAPGKVYARWTWSMSEQRAKRVDLGRPKEKPESEFVMLCFNCMGYICGYGNKVPDPVDSWSDDVTDKKTPILQAPCQRCGALKMDPS